MKEKPNSFWIVRLTGKTWLGRNNQSSRIVRKEDLAQRFHSERGAKVALGHFRNSSGTPLRKAEIVEAD